MPLPFALSHINLWLIEDGDGWTAVDSGIPDPRTRDLWQQVFAEPMAGRPLKRLVVTHFHPDHMGLAAWLTRRFGLIMESPLSEWLYGRMLSMDSGESFTEASAAFYRAAGLSAEHLTLAAERGNAYAARVKRVPASCRRIREGDELTIGGRKWQVLIGQGHAPELACLWCEELNLLISGDQILPSISPNVSVWPSEPEADQLTLFLASLEMFRRLSSDCLVLPSHGLPFFGLHERVDGLIGHHDERLAETLDACRNPVTAWDLLTLMFRRRLDDHQLFLAIGESLAHLHCLMTRGQVQRDIDSEGVHWFRQPR